MTDRIRAARSGVLVAAVCLLCAGCSLLPARPAAPAGHPALAHRAAHLSSGQAPAPQSTLLPFSPAQLQAAAALAMRFTAAYNTWSWQQPPAAWLAGLQPMTTSSLYGQLTQAAAIPSVLAQRNATQQAAAVTATSAQIRDLTPGTVTITVAVSQVITSASGTTRAAAVFAVTLTPQGSGWVVWIPSPPAPGTAE